MLVFLALGNAIVLSFVLGTPKLPDASSFASQWNIGLSVRQYQASGNVRTTKTGKKTIPSPRHLCTNKVQICRKTSDEV